MDEIDPAHMGRIAAQVSQQVILENIHNVKQEILFEEFQTKIGTITNHKHNLMKVICDSIEGVTGINDKYFRTETGDAVIDKTKEPTLFIEIKEE